MAVAIRTALFLWERGIMFDYLSLDDWKAKALEGNIVEDAVLRKSYADTDIKVIADERKIRITLSTGTVDRDNDTINPDGWDLSNYRKNPVVLWAHDYRSLPIANAVELSIVDGKLSAVDQFVQRDIYPFADTVFELLKAGYLHASSVGFRRKEHVYNEDRRGFDFIKQELLEHSIVPVPSNPEALVEARSVLGPDIMQPLIDWCEEALDTWHGEKGIWVSKSSIEQVFLTLETQRHHVVPEVKEPEEKYVPSDVSRSTASEDTSWSRPSLSDFTDESFDSLSATQRRRIAGHFAYSVNNPPETFGDLKLPHHQAGNGSVVWNGVRAAMGALLGARGGVDIPDGERRAVYGHLVSHYRQFDKEPPEFRFVEAQVLRYLPELFTLDEEGRLRQTQEECFDLNDFVASAFSEEHNNQDASELTLADLEPDDWRRLMGLAIGDSLTDALKMQITATTGRLVD